MKSRVVVVVDSNSPLLEEEEKKAKKKRNKERKKKKKKARRVDLDIYTHQTTESVSVPFSGSYSTNYLLFWVVQKKKYRR